jgi:competence protein ComEC
MTPSKIFLYFCLAFIGGIFLESFVEIPQLFGLGFLIFGLILISVFWKYKNFAVAGFCILFLVLGIWRHQEAKIRTTDNNLVRFNDSGENVTLTGIVAEEPSIKAATVKMAVSNGQGKILVTTGRYPEYRYGDELKITGKLKAPAEDIEGFNYKEYLAKDGIFSVMDWPKIELVAENQGNPVYKYLFAFKNKLKEGVNKVMSPPQSGLLEALFFGDEENITQEWKDKFDLTGTRHITAVSGMNITIISALILNFLLAIGLWRHQAFYAALILIILYILMIGAPASAVRAAIMGLIFLTAQHFGRAPAATRAVLMAATFMLAQNPLLLRLDVGFQLSFLAIMGLILLQPVFSEFFKKIPNHFQLRDSLTATASAQIFTLPILIYNFGRLPITSAFSNILIVPTLSFITILGFVFSFAAIIFYPLGLVLSWPVWLALTYILKIIDFFSKISFTSIEVKNVHWAWLAVFYLILIFLIWRWQEKQKLKFLQY